MIGRPADTPMRALRWLMAAIFVYYGLAKVGPDNTHWVEMFEVIGLGQWFRYATSAIELVGGLLLLSARWVQPAAVLLSLTMIGAAAIRFFVLGHSVGALGVPLACLTALVAIGVHARPEHARA